MELDLTGNETPEELEALLEKIGEVTVDDKTAPGNTSAAVTDTTVTGTTGAQTATTQAAASQQNTGDNGSNTPTPGVAVGQRSAASGQATDTEQATAAKILLSKDGKHAIPYDVLEAERAEKRRLAESNQRTAAELAEARRQLEVFTRQINAAGLQPAQLPEKSQITQEQLDVLRESFPDVANVIDVLAQKVEHLQAVQPVPAATQSNESNPVSMALDATPDLKAWQSDDPDRFTLAIHIDETLKHDPAWKDKSLTERFGEVVKRTRAAYGETVESTPQQSAPAGQPAQPTPAELQQKAADALAKATAAAQLPGSPSDVGQAATQSPSLLEQAANASPEQLHAMFSGMTDAQIEALLEQAI
ncbi:MULTISPECIES: hypothetical protein [Dickeya]|uniref:Phage protein n=1 Tax=Dickeya aquatica TaxID=1401087 RepID=A0A375ABS0_9GAMM|nr:MULTISPECIES: hypothetical protein [Dickeya]SLM63500.1 Phage protein [Dickeya aquatica]